MYYILIVVILLLNFFIAYIPKRLKIKLSNSNPPIPAWINSPSKDANHNQRLVNLTNNNVYSVPRSSSAHFILAFDWEVETEIDSQKTDLVIPSKFLTDFASILTGSFHHITNTVYAAIIHDYLYRNPEDLNAKAITKTQADRVFYWGMRMRGMNRLNAGLMYLAERIFGSPTI